jgi:hypothetical protein
MLNYCNSSSLHLEDRHMNDTPLFGRVTEPHENERQLAVWLLGVLAPETDEQYMDEDHLDKSQQLSLTLTSDYHPRFYQQLPDFGMALLHNDPFAIVHYAPLLYHLSGCSACCGAYLEIYDALRAAIYPRGARPLLGQGTRTLSATPHRMLSHLCQILISQAQAILCQAHHDHIDQDDAARALLRMALSVSAYITQSSLRRSALKELVFVATLFDGPQAPTQDDSQTYIYSPVLTSTGGRSRIVRHADMLSCSQFFDANSIEIQSQTLVGRIVQHDGILELHLQDLAQSWCGHYVTVSVLLGSLLEPVRWHGGDPRAIRSTLPVQMDGSLVAPLGQTDLHLQKTEERNLLEAMFMLLEVHIIK